MGDARSLQGSVLYTEDGDPVDVDASDRLRVNATPVAPDGSTEVVYAGDTPLDISGTETSEYTITDGTTLYIQQVAAGAEGDPTAKGSKIEVYFYDGTEHLFDRIYVTGATVNLVYPDASKCRDNTVMVGSGTDNKLRVRRTRMSGSLQEVDAVVRGYEQ